jgi:asparaginase
MGLAGTPDAHDRKTIAMQIFEVAPPAAGPSLALHGGAGGRVAELTPAAREPYEQGLLDAYRAGWQVLAAGGGALDAVCASVEVLENDPQFNAGRGAALTATGQAELDASVMTGTGLAGAVAASKYAARICYAGADLPGAVRDTFREASERAARQLATVGRQVREIETAGLIRAQRVDHGALTVLAEGARSTPSTRCRLRW